MQKFEGDHISLHLEINGETKRVFVRPANTLLYVLREQLGLTGAKPGCLNGDCGACTVQIDRLPMKSCLMLAIEARKKKITTIEGLKNTPLQQAFIDHFAFQCGYCTPGFILNAHALLTHHPQASDSQMKEWLESNICRCTGYKEIEEAVKSVMNQNHPNKM
ncbi:(2Fe-2S)-binding protein [Ammoniphilus sp. YIM 78166]|uniref:(2Fe-2S)-binding protein n=1 Tax=Ammoniphilus sp. YIM 78166 TaxID=1644106 RepID=UPI00106F0E74|nr:(2Fe-2S)-binding protein [Ammoniphilus sp. YIM 78166]